MKFINNCFTIIIPFKSFGSYRKAKRRLYCIMNIKLQCNLMETDFLPMNIPSDFSHLRTYDEHNGGSTMLWKLYRWFPLLLYPIIT